MIKVNELRIGNFIVDDDGALSKVIGFKPYEHSIRCDEEEGCDILIDIHGADGKVRTGYAVESTETSPIPLTPEWLERCGFISTLSGDDFHSAIIWDDPKSDYHYCEAGYFIDNRGDYGHYCDIGDIKYLHQLQNLYFALTGKELTINNVNLQIPS